MGKEEKRKGIEYRKKNINPFLSGINNALGVKESVAQKLHILLPAVILT